MIVLHYSGDTMIHYKCTLSSLTDQRHMPENDNVPTVRGKIEMINNQTKPKEWGPVGFDKHNHLLSIMVR